MALGKFDSQIISPRSNKHKLVENNQCRKNSNRKKRSRCVGCNERLRKELGKNEAQKKCKQVNTMCETCETNPYYCIDCFQIYHK